MGEGSGFGGIGEDGGEGAFTLVVVLAGEVDDGLAFHVGLACEDEDLEGKAGWSGFEPTDRDKELLGFGECLGTIGFLVEEAVTGTWIDVGVAAGAGGFHVDFVFAEDGDADEFVGIAEEDAGRGSGFGDVVGGREIAEAIAEPLVAPLAGTVVEDWVEEDEGVGFAGDGGVVGGVVETGDEGGEGSEVAAGRAACGGDAGWVDAEIGGVAADEAHG